MAASRSDPPPAPQKGPKCDRASAQKQLGNWPCEQYNLMAWYLRLLQHQKQRLETGKTLHPMREHAYHFPGKVLTDGMISTTVLSREATDALGRPPDDGTTRRAPTRIDGLHAVVYQDARQVVLRMSRKLDKDAAGWNVEAWGLHGLLPLTSKLTVDSWTETNSDDYTITFHSAKKREQIVLSVKDGQLTLRDVADEVTLQFLSLIHI